MVIGYKKKRKKDVVTFILRYTCFYPWVYYIHRDSWKSHLCVPDVLQEYMSKARDMERELRNLTIEKTRAEALLEVSCNIYIIGLLMLDGLKKHR